MAAGAVSAREGRGSSRQPEPGGAGGDRQWGPGPQPGRQKGEVGEMEPSGETDLSEVMLIFQVGGERTSVPRWDSSSSLPHESLW